MVDFIYIYSILFTNKIKMGLLITIEILQEAIRSIFCATASDYYEIITS